MSDPYHAREQTQAKHFLLRSYLQALAFKILHVSDLTYVDGFSGPWETATEDFADSSFMIAIQALKDAQQKIFEATRIRRRIRCFFSEADADAFAKLELAVAKYHRPAENFEIKTFHGKFEDAVVEIQTFIGRSFALIFIDPTGWSGYPFEKIRPLLLPRSCEVLINFMYSFIRRFIEADDPAIISSLDPILGGPGWRQRLNPLLPRGDALLELFRDALRASGNFEFVVATKIDKPIEDRPHFFMAYGTKAYAGLKTFRDIEHKALRLHAVNRASAKTRHREEKSGSVDLFAHHEASVQEASVEDVVGAEIERASGVVLDFLHAHDHVTFERLSGILMERFMLRESNVKDLLVVFERKGILENTWGGGTRKPKGDNVIKLKKGD